MCTVCPSANYDDHFRKLIGDQTGNNVNSCQGREVFRYEGGGHIRNWNFFNFQISCKFN
jgi:hypothetical protein